jgi:uncharacterized protein DUF6178
VPDNPNPLARLPRRSSQRAEAILADRDPAARVAELPVQDLYFLVKDLGLDEAHDIVALASPEQFQGMLDFDTWNLDHFDDAALRPWLEALLTAPLEQIASVWRGLDQELTALALGRWVRVYDIIEGEVPDWEEPPLVATPDRFYVLKILSSDPDQARQVELLIDRLYRADQELARHSIRAASSEPPGELEEMAYRWRAGRMQDLGYAAFEEALEVYRPIDVSDVKLDEATADTPVEAVTLPAIYIEPVRKGFLGRAIGRMDDPEELRRLEAALVTLLNRVLAANRINPSDTVAAAAAAAQGTATLSLGLETTARGDLDRAEEALRKISLIRLHRVGHSLGLTLARLARTIGPRAARAEEPYLSLLTGLRAVRPQLARALDTPPDLGYRPFASVADVRAATQAMAVLAGQVSLVHDALGVDPAALGPAVTLGDLGRTAIVNFVLGRPLAPAPLTPEDVLRFAQTRRDEAAILQAFEAKKIDVPKEWPAAIRGWIGDLEHELGSLATDAPPDKRFVKGLLLK